MSQTSTRTFDGERPMQVLESSSVLLVLLWSLEEPERVGEVVPLPTRPAVFGRASPDTSATPPVLGLERRRPGRASATGGLDSPHVSRVQWQLVAQADGSVAITNLGRAKLRIGGRLVDSGVARPGELVEIVGLVLFRVATRLAIPSPRVRLPSHPFGAPDADGIVGETNEVWDIRERLAFVAARNLHVLVLGPSGTGKELVGRAIHRLSSRARGPFVARNAATIPSTLVDAELFGNARNYPNPGMAERPGLIGEADGGTLFLDEVGELPVSLQTHLLRVLDAGEYARLGEARTRRADFRLVAATNRPVDSLREDVGARFPLTIELPSLRDRVDDVPLLARHILRRIHTTDPAAVERYFDPNGVPRMSVDLVERLVRHPWQANVRELEALLWDAIAQSPDATLEPPTAYTPPPAAPPARDPADFTPEELQAALDRNGGSQEETWRELGLASRHVLTRLVKRFGLKVRGRSRGDEAAG